MPSVEKITISLPADLLALIEEHRAGDGRSRSEVVADLLWRGWQAVELESREQRYRRAYAAEPDTPEESAWAELAAEDLLTGDPGSAAVAPRSRKRRATG